LLGLLAMLSYTHVKTPKSRKTRIDVRSIRMHCTQAGDIRPWPIESNTPQDLSKKVDF
jgi:hypothetical protein